MCLDQSHAFCQYVGANGPFVALILFQYLPFSLHPPIQVKDRMNQLGQKNSILLEQKSSSFHRLMLILVFPKQKTVWVPVDEILKSIRPVLSLYNSSH